MFALLVYRCACIFSAGLYSLCPEWYLSASINKWDLGWGVRLVSGVNF